ADRPGFSSSFTTPGFSGAHEKRGVEGEVRRFRRRWLTPVPAVASREDLHDLLLDACVAVKGTETCDHCAVQGLRRIEPPLRRRLGRAVLPHVLAPATAAGRRRLLGGPREGRRDPGAPSPVGRPAAPGEPSAAPPARPAG